MQINSLRARYSAVVLCVFILGATADAFFTNGLFQVRKHTRFNIPWLGMGVICNGCPHLSCEDDPAIIHGYCCGCAMALDRLPVMCPNFLQCPLNPAGLCHDYEYMMRCCC